MNNPNKVCFIYCANDEDQLQESLTYVAHLNIPEGFEVEEISVRDAASMTAGYNEAMRQSDAKYKVYLHQDTLIVNRDFIRDCIQLFEQNTQLGILGMIGAAQLPPDGVWWNSSRKFGKTYESHTGKMTELAFEEVESSYERVVSVDGFLIVTQYDIPWRENVFDGWHFYDLSQCAEFMKAGYEVGIPRQVNPWTMHDCGIVNVRNGYEEYRKRFLHEYGAVYYPKVSILIPTYNRPHFFELALKSALDQTYSHIEIIVCDDSTNDETERLIHSYLSRYNNIKYYKNEKNLGQFLNDLKCMELATGEYVNFLMDDDLLHSSKIERMMGYFCGISGQDITIVTSHRQLIDDRGNFLPDIRSTTKLFQQDTIVDGVEFGNYMLSVPTNFIGEPTTVLFRKRDLEEPFGTFLGREYECNVDLASWVNLLAKGKIVYIADTLSYFRIHETQQQQSEKMFVAGMLDFAHQILNSPLKSFFREEKQYSQAISNCLLYINNIEKMISEEYKQEPKFQQVFLFKDLLNQKQRSLKAIKLKDQLLSQLLVDAPDKYYCPVCESKLKFLNPLPAKYHEDAEKYGYKHFGRGEMSAIETYSCPLCGASDRERLYAYWMNEQIGITLHCESNIIHFAPETSLSQWIRKKGFTNYKTADLMMNQVDYNVDICNLPFSDEQYDFFICSHVLEHVFDDDLAISELYRITKKGGIGILMAPISVDLEHTLENPNIKDISERYRLFGQEDHVRLYAHDDYVSKIKKPGFFVKELNKDHFNNENFQLLGLKSTSILYIVQKPRGD